MSIFSSLAGEQRAELARTAKLGLFAAGEITVKQGEEGSSMFVVARGEAVVTLEPSNQEVARIGSGGFFGEMSLLTGEPRNATVQTTVDSELLEITVDVFESPGTAIKTAPPARRIRMLRGCSSDNCSKTPSLPPRSRNSR